MRKPITEYIGHGGRDEYSELWPTDAEQQREFHYSLYELELDCEVDLETGKLYLQGVSGVKLEHEVEV